MKSAIYTRVSTNEQALKGYSLEAQENKIRAYCAYKEYDVEGIYCDDGFSGADTNRPALQKLIKKVKAKQVDVVVVYKLDRLSRSLRDALVLVDLFIEYDVTLFSLNENIDLSTPFGRASLKMSATWAELERETIRERMIMGKDARNQSGLMMCSGIAPFGYNFIKDEKRFEINEVESEIVKDIFTKYSSGLYSIRQLGLYCKNTYNHPYFGNPMACKAILHRLMYTGFFGYKDKLIEGKNFNGVISMELWKKAQTVAKVNTTKRNRENTPYLLTGLVVCAECGNRYVGKTRKHYKTENGIKTLAYEYRSYGCAARIKNDKNYHSAKCESKIFDADTLDTIVLETIANLSFSELKNHYSPNGIMSQTVIANAQLTEKKEKLLDLYLEGGISKELYTSKCAEIDLEIESNNKLFKTEEDNLANYSTIDIDELKQRHSTLLSLTKAEQRKLLTLFIKQIVITDGKPLVTFNVK